MTRKYVVWLVVIIYTVIINAIIYNRRTMGARDMCLLTFSSGGTVLFAPSFFHV